MKFSYLISALALLSGLTQIAAAPIGIDVDIETRELDELEFFERDLDVFDFDLVAREPAGPPSPPPSAITVDPKTGISYSDNPKDWPTEEQMNKLLTAPKDGAWFWTGRAGSATGEGVMLKAGEMAKAKWSGCLISCTFKFERRYWTSGLSVFLYANKEDLVCH